MITRLVLLIIVTSGTVHASDYADGPYAASKEHLDLVDLFAFRDLDAETLNIAFTCCAQDTSTTTAEISLLYRTRYTIHVDTNDDYLSDLQFRFYPGEGGEYGVVTPENDTGKAKLGESISIASNRFYAGKVSHPVARDETAVRQWLASSARCASNATAGLRCINGENTATNTNIDKRVFAFALQAPLSILKDAPSINVWATSEETAR